MLVLQKLRAGEVREPDRIASFMLGTARQLAIDTRRNAGRRERLLETFAFDLEPRKRLRRTRPTPIGCNIVCRPCPSVSARWWS